MYIFVFGTFGQLKLSARPACKMGYLENGAINVLIDIL